jgi:hypothetical protein
VQKWKARKDATKLAYLRIERLKVKFTRIRKMLVFNGIRERFLASKDFMNKMSILANIHDQQALKMGYNSIISFSRAKNYVFQKKKELASKDIYAILSNLMVRRMNSYFSELKFKTTLAQKETLHKFFTVSKNLSNKTRQYFLKWKAQASFITLQEEIDGEGPVREQVFEQKQMLDNCKKFMMDEGYHERDIA